MGFFTIGNLLTLGIVLLILILYRHMDRNNRNRNLLRDYSEKLKKEIASFVEEKERAVRDYSVLLGVEKDSAKELMKRLQMTEEEMAEKAAAITRIDSQIKSYENSLAELDRMTSRVQENMNRVRDESAFVDSTGARIEESKARLEELEKELGDLENRFERENAESLDKAVDTVLASIKTDISDLGAQAETAERRVEDYRDEISKQVEAHMREVNRIDEIRAAGIARDLDQINNILKNAVEEAGKKADKMEETALLNLREKAEDRIQKLKAAEEEKLRSYQESARARVVDVQNMVKGIREEWFTEKEERRKEIQELGDLVSGTEKRIEECSVKANGIISSHETMLNILFSDSRERFSAELSGVEKRVHDLSGKAEELISAHEAMLAETAGEMKQKALEITGAKLDEYRRAQDAEFRQLEKLADDSRNLDAELRRNMQEVIDRMTEDFSRYERESAETRKTETDKFTAAASSLKAEMAEAESELDELKTAARENVSEKLKLFEDDFLLDLSRRSGDIDQRLLDWQENLDKRLTAIDEEGESLRRELEQNLTEEMRNKLSVQDSRLSSELEHLRSGIGAFEEGIRERMNTADDSVSSFREQLDASLEETRKEAELSIKSEIGKYSISSGETIKQYNRDVDGKLREMSEFIQTRNLENSELIDVLRGELDEARNSFSGKIRDLDDSMEDARRRVRDLSAETDTRISQVRSSVDETERHIRDAVDQTKLLDRAEELKLEMERRIEDLKGDIDRLDQRRAEIAQLENDFVKIRRLEDDVNAKMTRFLSEKHRIETMETDFNRLLQISRAVEEKLTQVTSSDDLLQGVQLQIRRLEESLGTTDEKFKRVERKSQILDNTNDGIDRNFRQLQESEKIAAKLSGDMSRFTEDLSVIRVSIEKLAGESDKAREAAERLDVLNNVLEEIDERIESMQKARRWIADAEARLEELNKDVLTQIKAVTNATKGGRNKGPLQEKNENVTSQQIKETVIALRRKDWPIAAIAQTMKLTIGEVELILEMAPKD